MCASEDLDFWAVVASMYALVVASGVGAADDEDLVDSGVELCDYAEDSAVYLEVWDYDGDVWYWTGWYGCGGCGGGGRIYG